MPTMIETPYASKASVARRSLSAPGEGLPDFDHLGETPAQVRHVIVGTKLHIRHVPKLPKEQLDVGAVAAIEMDQVAATGVGPEPQRRPVDSVVLVPHRIRIVIDGIDGALPRDELLDARFHILPGIGLSPDG